MKEWLLALLPSIVCGILLWYISRKFQAQDMRYEKREQDRVLNNVLILQGVSASLSLGEATAEAIETQHWNGEMQDARAYAKETKREIEGFMMRMGSKHLQ